MRHTNNPNSQRVHFYLPGEVDAENLCFCAMSTAGSYYTDPENALKYLKGYADFFTMDEALEALEHAQYIMIHSLDGSDDDVWTMIQFHKFDYLKTVIQMVHNLAIDGVEVVYDIKSRGSE